MAKAWCPWCQELIPILPNGKDPAKTNKRQTFITHPNKNPDRKEPNCEGSDKDI